MIRSLLLTCMVLVGSTFCWYALATPLPRADLTYVNPSGIHTLDPARMSWTQDFRVALNIWEGLTTWHPETTEVIAGAALFPPHVSSDGLTRTFVIKEDTRWSNGDPVTAGDFVRAWRRGMEPGTATDYTFLFTDHIAGAAQYVRWRRGAVALLTCLKRLGDGWNISAEQVRTLMHSSVLDRLDSTSAAPFDVPQGARDDAAWSALATRLSDSDVDWGSLYREAWEAHASELDTRFSRVGLRTPDDRTLVVELTQPCPYFLDLTAMPIFLPCHRSIERLRERHSGAAITATGLVAYDPQWTKPDYHQNGYPGLITNGPYRLSDWIFKRRLRLTVNPHYRSADAIACRTVDMLVFENIHASIMAYEAGDVDFLPAMDVPYDHEIARLARSGERPDFHLCPASATYFLNFNCRDATVRGRANPFVDRRVRRAFCLATDKRAIVDKVLRRGDRVASSFVPPGSMMGYDPPSGIGLDVKRARESLAAAGFPGGEGMPVVELLYIPSDERICQALSRMWEQTLGVRVELRSKESKTFAEDKANRHYMIARANWYADYNDPTTFLDCLTSGSGNNDSGYRDEGYDALLAAAGAQRDRAKRAEILKEAEAIIVERDLPILPILHYSVPIAIKPHVVGLYPNARLWFPFKSVTFQR